MRRVELVLYYLKSCLVYICYQSTVSPFTGVWTTLISSPEAWLRTPTVEHWLGLLLGV